ncbi:MAG: hypothetical protein WKF83_04675 [Nocardioidaceae bacterium]
MTPELGLVPQGRRRGAQEHHDRRRRPTPARPRCCAHSPTRSIPEERLVTVERALELGLGEFEDLHPNVVAFEERLAELRGPRRRVHGRAGPPVACG